MVCLSFRGYDLVGPSKAAAPRRSTARLSARAVDAASAASPRPAMRGANVSPGVPEHNVGWLTWRSRGRSPTPWGPQRLPSDCLFVRTKDVHSAITTGHCKPGPAPPPRTHRLWAQASGSSTVYDGQGRLVRRFAREGRGPSGKHGRERPVGGTVLMPQDVLAGGAQGPRVLPELPVKATERSRRMGLVARLAEGAWRKATGCFRK